MYHRCANCDGIDPPSCMFNPDRPPKDSRLERELFGKPLGETYRAYLEYHQMREARPRVACSDCQFEYVEEDGHECDPGTVPLP